MASLVYFYCMFNQEVRRLLVEVIRSWQVWAVTAVLVLYVFLVNYVARLYHRSPRRRLSMPKNQPDASAEPSESDELGLEEDTKA